MELTKRQREVLEGLAAYCDGESDELDLVYNKGGGWWFGFQKTNGKMGMWLLRNCLIKPIDGEPTDWESTVTFEITSWGRKVLKDPEFDPQMEILRLRAQAEGKQAEGKDD